MFILKELNAAVGAVWFTRLGSTAGLFSGHYTSVLSSSACISYLLTYYVLESRHRLDRDRHRQLSILQLVQVLNWAGHPTSTTPTNDNNSHVELAHAHKERNER